MRKGLVTHPAAYVTVRRGFPGLRPGHDGDLDPALVPIGSIGRRIAPAVDIPHRLTHRAGRGGTAPSSSIMLADLLCELVVWHEDHARVREALRSLDGFEPFVLEPPAHAQRSGRP